MRRLNVSVLTLCVVAVSIVGSGCQNITANQVGVKTVNIALWGKRGIEQTPYAAGTYFYNPLLSEFTVFDKSEKKLEMTAAEQSGRRGIDQTDNIRLKTSDGNSVWIDVTVIWQIDQNRANLVLDNVGRSDEEILQTLVLPESRSVIRAVLGELTTEQFYDSAARAEKATRAEEVLRKEFEPHGLLLISVLVRDYKFSPEYEAAIEEKKVAEEQAKQNKSLTEAAVQDAQRKLRAAEGEAYQAIATANGAKEKTKLEADAALYEKQQQAEAILAQKKAEAESTRQLVSALDGPGGVNLIAREAARAIQGKRIIMLPMGDGGTINFADMDKLLDRFGVAQTAPVRAKPPTQ